MQTVFTFILIIFIGVTAMGQNATKAIKVETVTYEVELTVKIKKSATPEHTVARVYKFKNTRVKKALHFNAKNNKAKMA